MNSMFVCFGIYKILLLNQISVFLEIAQLPLLSLITETQKRIIHHEISFLFVNLQCTSIIFEGTNLEREFFVTPEVS